MKTSKVSLSSNPTFRLGEEPVTISPDRARIIRLLFISSMWFLLTTNRKPTKMELKDVNSRFNLACRDNALLLPAVIASWLWRKSKITEVYRTYKGGVCCIGESCTQVIDSLPKWLIYSDTVRMQKDIQSIFDGIE